MWEFAASEFDSLMRSYAQFRHVAVDPMVSSGSLVLGVEELRYSDGLTTVLFVGSSAAMHLRISRRHKRSAEEVVLDKQFTDFAEVREQLREHIG